MNRRETVVAALPWRSHRDIPVVVPEQMAAINGLLSGQRSFLLAEEGGGERQASLAAVEAPAGEIVALRLGDGVVHIDAAAAAKPADRPDWRDHGDPGSRQLAWSLAASPALTLVGQLFRSPVDAVDIHVGADAAAPAFWIRIDIAASADGTESGPADALQLTLGLGNTHLRRLAELPRRLDQALLSQRLESWSRLQGRLRLQLPGPSLTPAQLRGLQRNDVIVLGQRRLIETGTARLVLDGSSVSSRAWPIKLIDGLRAQVAGPGVAGRPRNQQENPVIHEAGNPPDGASAPDGETAPLSNPVERLPVQVEFDLGRMDLPLLQLAQIEPGYIFPLPQALEQARVAIRLNGTLAGTGELVAIGDVLGVRLTAWTNGPDID